jgi:NADP-dependent aldehyde dehydrogenase
MRIAAERAVPIPVYAEMSAVNPVVLMRGALEQKGEELGKAYAASLSMGVGQFCTNPGIVLAIDTPGLERFVQAAVASVSEMPAGVMLTSGIAEGYERGVERLSGKPGMSVLATGPEGDGPNRGLATLFGIDADAFGADPEIAEEVFGAASVLVRCADADALTRALEGMEGQLTTTVHFTREDEADVATMLPVLERRAGRLIANGWPTGVEVGHAMVHGGPFPATSDGRSTSVGPLAIERFLRPVCYQHFPDTLLPPVLQGNGPDGVPRRIDGRMTL